MVVPLVIIHREQNVVARICQQPHVIGFGSTFDVAHGREHHPRVGDNAATRLEQNRHLIKQMLSFRVARRFACHAQSFGENDGRLKIRAQHVALMLGKLICLRTIAQIVHRDAAAQVDVLERVARLAMNRHQVVPHALEGFGERLDVRRLRADVNVYAADVNQFGML